MARVLLRAVVAVVLAVVGVTTPVSAAGSAAPVPDVNGVAAGNAAIGSVDLAGRWSFTPAGRPATTITVPGGGWYKQGFTDVSEATYSRTITVPESGQPQSAWIEFGALIRSRQLSSRSTIWTARSSNESAPRTTRNGSRRQPSDRAMPSSAEHHDDAVYAGETTHSTASAQRNRS